MGKAIHDNFREAKLLYNEANEEIFDLSNPRFENGKSGIAKDEDLLLEKFKQIRRKLIEINKLIKNYIDNYVVTEEVSTGFMLYMAEKNKSKAQEDDFSLTEILEYLKENSSKRDIQKHEQDLFVMCDMLNSFLLDKHFTLSDDKVASGYYAGTPGESLEQTSKNSIGLSNFVANFGKVLHERIIKGKPETEIKRVMDTEPVDHNDTDFEMYQIPFKKDKNDVIIQGITENSSLLGVLDNQDKQITPHENKSVKSSTSTQNTQTPGELQNLHVLDEDLDQLVSKEQEDVRVKEHEIAQDNMHKVELVNDNQDDQFDEMDNDDDFEAMPTKKELEEEHQKKLEKNEKMFEGFDKEIQENQINHEASPVHETSPVHDDFDHHQSEIDAVQIQDNESNQDIHNEENQVSPDQSLHHENPLDTQNTINSSEILDNLDQSDTNENQLNDENNLDETQSHISENQLIDETQSHLSENQLIDEGETNVDNKNSRKLTNKFNKINPKQATFSGKIKMKKIKKKSKNTLKISKSSDKKKERKLNLSSFLSRKHKRFQSSHIFKKRTFLPKNELITKKTLQKKQKVFTPIRYGYSDKGYINPTIISKDNTTTFNQKFKMSKNNRKLKQADDRFSVYGKKKWFKPKMKIFRNEPNLEGILYNENPMMNLI